MSPTSKNFNNFEQFIEQNGQVGLWEANLYADIGQEIIKNAMASQNMGDFEAKMKALKDKYFSQITDGKHSVSNMASCLLYAQTRDNFTLHQGYGKGSNINQYGDKETSERAVRHLMTYFSKKQANKEHGYNAVSSHRKWRDPNQRLPDDIPDLKLRIDIDSDPKTGSIPAPLKGIHTAHFVPGVDKDGTIKLLVKPENWGMSKLLHKIMHALDYFLTRFQAQNIKGLESRQETKLTKEATVTEGYTALKTELKNNINQLEDKSLKQLLKDISNDLDPMKKKKGFEKPMEALMSVQERLNRWLERKEPHCDYGTINLFKESVDKTMETMTKRKDAKYASGYQIFSEVRLNYGLDGSVSVDRQGFKHLKNELHKVNREPPVQETKNDRKNKPVR